MPCIDRFLRIGTRPRRFSGPRRTATVFALTVALVVTGSALAARADDDIDKQFEAAGMELKAAVANGEMTESEAWAAWHATRREIISAAAEAGTIAADKAAEWLQDINKEQLGGRLKQAGARIKAAAERGEISGEEAWAEWYATKERLISDAVALNEITAADAAQLEGEMYRAELKERIEASGKQIRAAVIEGEMTADDGWAAWRASREGLIAEAVELGEVSAADADRFRRGYERWEVGQRLKTAVARGEMTEEEARAAWAEYNAEFEHAKPGSKTEQKDDRALAEEPAAEEKDVQARGAMPDDVWARYVRAFIARYQLDERQQNQAWRFYREARQRSERRAERLARRGDDESEPQETERLNEARKRLERDRERLFERLKGQLETLPTGAQRRAAAAKQEKK